MEEAEEEEGRSARLGEKLYDSTVGQKTLQGRCAPAANDHGSDLE